MTQSDNKTKKQNKINKKNLRDGVHFIMKMERHMKVNLRKIQNMDMEVTDT